MTKEQYLESDVIIANVCNIDKSQKIDIKEFEFTYQAQIFTFEVFQTYYNLSNNYAVKVVVADGIDLFNNNSKKHKDRSFRSYFGWSFYVNASKAILNYCKSRNLVIIEVFGDIPTAFVGVQDANIDTLFLEQIETY